MTFDEESAIDAQEFLAPPKLNILEKQIDTKIFEQNCWEKISRQKKSFEWEKKSSWLWKGPSKVARKSAPIQLHPFGNLGASDTDSEDEM